MLKDDDPSQQLDRRFGKCLTQTHALGPPAPQDGRRTQLFMKHILVNNFPGQLPVKPRVLASHTHFEWQLDIVQTDLDAGVWMASTRRWSHGFGSRPPLVLIRSFYSRTSLASPDFALRYILV